MTGETPNPLDVIREIVDRYAYDTTRTELLTNSRRALAQVAALAEAAQRVTANYIGAESGVRVDNLAFIELGAALVPFAAHKDTA